MFGADTMNRAKLALGSYWALFIIAPLVVCFVLLGASARAAGYCVPILVVLCVIGEHGLLDVLYRSTRGSLRRTGTGTDVWQNQPRQ